MRQFTPSRNVQSCVTVEPLEGRRLLSISPVSAVASAALAVPVLNSRPQSGKQLYLDFDGEPAFVENTSRRVPVTPAYSIDSDTSTFSAADRAAIERVWRIVAEKYAPFDINVTTVRPATFADNKALQVLIGGSGEWWNIPGRATAAGVAGIGTFYTSDTMNIAYVFPEIVSADPARVANIATHESGHSFGFQHRSTIDDDGDVVDEYTMPPTDGQNRGFIMGWIYGPGRLVWDNAPVQKPRYGKEDELALLGGLLGTLPDTEGNTGATAVPLTHTGHALTTNGFTHAIQSTSDADYHRFTTAGGAVDLTVTGPEGGMLDMTVQLRDTSGKVLATVGGFETGDVDQIRKRLYATVPAGTYDVVVTSSGGYGNIGRYAIEGTEGAAIVELSAGRAYTASGTVFDTSPTNAGDHNSTTVWAADTDIGAWLQVDLGQARSVTGIRVTWANAPRDYRVQISSDAKTWTELVYKQSSAGGEEVFGALNATGRYVRLVPLYDSFYRFVSVREFAVLGPTGTTPPPTPTGTDLARAGVATASSSDNSSRSPANAIDGNSGTRWASQYSDNQWIQVDLKSAVNVTSVRLNWEAAYAKAYKIQFSTNGTTWTDKLAVNNGDGGVDELAVSGSARYVRVQGVTRATTYGYSLYDFNVYGTTTPTPPPADTASISGTAFNDANKNGKQDAGDSVAAGKTIWLDLNDDGVKDANEPSAVTASNGTFSFKNLAAGTYHVRRVFPAGYFESTPARYVTLTAGQTSGGVLIGSKTK